MTHNFKILCLVLLIGLTGCKEDTTYTLYRETDHIATFDAEGKNPTYNKRNCEDARQLFQHQISEMNDYFCKAGEYQAPEE